MLGPSQELVGLLMLPLFPCRGDLSAIASVGRVIPSDETPCVSRDQVGLHEVVKLVQVDIAEDGRNHASYNVAKKVLAFVYQVAIQRSHLRATYGGGFQGAPLRCTKRQEEGSFTRGSGACNEQACSQEKQDGGGADHV